MKRLLVTGVVLGLALVVVVRAQTPAAPPRRPPRRPRRQRPPHRTTGPPSATIPGGMKYSPLTQITPANVAQLAKAWTYDMGVPAAGYTITPIVINNVMYLPVQGTIIVALKADAGTELWKFDLKTIPGHRRPTRRPAAAASRTGPARRSVAPRIVIATTNGFLVQLDAKTGKPIPGPAGLDQPGHRRHGEVRRQLLDQHAAGALQEPRDHRGTHRRAGPLRHARRSARRSIC